MAERLEKFAVLDQLAFEPALRGLARAVVRFFPSHLRSCQPGHQCNNGNGKNKAHLPPPQRSKFRKSLCVRKSKWQVPRVGQIFRTVCRITRCLNPTLVRSRQRLSSPCKKFRRTTLSVHFALCLLMLPNCSYKFVFKPIVFWER